MRKVQKQARDLRPGDVLLDQAGKVSGLVVGDVSIPAPGVVWACICYIGDTPNTSRPWQQFAAGAVLDVADLSACELTPAQQHADELVALLRYARHGGFSLQWDADADALLAEIPEPVPPALEKALDVLREGGWDEGEIEALRAYARARRGQH